MRWVPGFLVALLALGSARADIPPEPPTAASPGQGVEQIVATRWPEAKVTESGLRYVVIAKGEGDAKPAKGARVRALYKGTFLDGKVFDKSTDPREPFVFPVGLGRVIKGWDEAFLDMKKGEQRTLIIPPHLAYGPRGYPGAIPPDSTLVFEVTLLGWE